MATRTYKYTFCTHAVWVLAMVGAGREVTESTSKVYRTNLTKRGFIRACGGEFTLTASGLESLEKLLKCFTPDPDAAFQGYMTEALALLPAVRAGVVPKAIECGSLVRINKPGDDHNGEGGKVIDTWATSPAVPPNCFRVEFSGARRPTERRNYKRSQVIAL